MGITGFTKWVNPIIEFHDAREKHNGARPSFVFPRVNRRWELERAEPAAYSTTRRKLALLRVGADGTAGETYTLHSPKNFLPKAETQMNSGTRELNAIGNWSSSSRTNERYDRSVFVCKQDSHSQRSNAEDGFGLGDGGLFQLPDNVPGTERIGKAQTKTPTVENSAECTQPGFPAGEGPLAAVTPAMEVELDNTHSTVPTLLNSQEPSPKGVTPEVSDPKLV